MEGIFWWIIPLVVTVAVLVPVIKLLYGMAKKGAERTRLLQTGLDAQAQVMGAQQTGTFISHNPEVVIMLNVQHPTGRLYQAQARMVVQLIQMASLAPGTVVRVKIDPNDPNSVTIVM